MTIQPSKIFCFYFIKTKYVEPIHQASKKNRESTILIELIPQVQYSNSGVWATEGKRVFLSQEKKDLHYMWTVEIQL